MHHIHSSSPTTTHISSRHRSAVALLSAAALLAGILGAVPPGVAHAARPDEVVFDPTPLPAGYQTTEQERALPHGTLIRAQRIYSNHHFRTTPAYRLLYATRNTHMQPVLGSAALVLPVKPQLGQKGKNGPQTNPPLVVINDMINSLGRQCQPSFALDSTNPVYLDKNQRVYEEAQRYLKLGWAVLMPDHLGMESAYGANILGGHIILDGIRAATSAPQFQLTKSKSVMTGYSGGSMTTLYAAALQPTYAPDLNLVGASAGGIPADFLGMVDLFSKLGPITNPAIGYGVGAMIGIEREYGPGQAPSYKNMTKHGQKLVREAVSLCHDDMLEVFSKDSYTTLWGNRDPYTLGSVDVARQNSILYFAPMPKVPLFIYGTYTDVGTPLSTAQKLVGRYKKQDPTLPILFVPQIGPDHWRAFLEGQPQVTAWIFARFAGKPAPNNMW